MIIRKTNELLAAQREGNLIKVKILEDELAELQYIL